MVTWVHNVFTFVHRVEVPTDTVKTLGPAGVTAPPPESPPPQPLSRQMKTHARARDFIGCPLARSSQARDLGRRPAPTYFAHVRLAQPPCARSSTPSVFGFEASCSVMP